MAKARLAIALEGVVSLQNFKMTMVHFDCLIKALCTHIDKQSSVDWNIVGLEAGSATATVEGISLDGTLLAKVMETYLDIGTRLQSGETLPYPTSITRPAAKLTQVLNGGVTAVRFRTEAAEATIVHHIMPTEDEGSTYSFGEVRGTVETLQRRRRLRFTLYDELFDQKVVCHLRRSQEAMMGQFWGKEVVVSGEIRWDIRTGRPIEVRDVHDIQFLPIVPPGSYEHARGVWDLETDQPETRLRRLRDGGEV